MDDCVQFFSEVDSFIAVLLPMLRDNISSEILISGIWDGIIYKKIIEEIMKNNYTDKIRIIIPNILNKRTLSLTLINKIIRMGGMVGINNNYRNNMIIIDGKAYIASYTSRYNNELRYKNYFEYCIFTDCKSTVNEVKRLFNEKWNKSYPLVADEAQGDLL